MRGERVLPLCWGCRLRLLADEDALFVWVGVIFLGTLGTAGAGTFATYHISARITALQSEARTIEAASTDVTQVIARTAEPEKSKSELQPKLQQLTPLKTSIGVGMQSSLLTPPQPLPGASS